MTTADGAPLGGHPLSTALCEVHPFLQQILALERESKAKLNINKLFSKKYSIVLHLWKEMLPE